MKGFVSVGYYLNLFMGYRKFELNLIDELLFIEIFGF